MGEPSFLFVFSSQCSYCDKNWPQWDRLRVLARSRSIRTVYANVGQPLEPAYIKLHGIDSRLVVQDISTESKLIYRLDATPMTFLFDGQGKLITAHVGALDAKALRPFESSIEALSPHDRASPLGH